MFSKNVCFSSESSVTDYLLLGPLYLKGTQISLIPLIFQPPFFVRLFCSVVNVKLPLDYISFCSAFLLIVRSWFQCSTWWRNMGSFHAVAGAILSAFLYLSIHLCILLIFTQISFLLFARLFVRRSI